MVEEGNRAADSTIEAWGGGNKFYHQKSVFIGKYYCTDCRFECLQHWN